MVGIAYFCILASPQFNGATYFSENALLPGLVKSEFRDEPAAKQYHAELLDEMKKYEDSLPYSWLLAKFQQIGLDTYTHNFSLNYPLGKGQKFPGKNVYGIIRAPRAASTEALVLTVPYRPKTSVHPTTVPSIAIMLAFAKFAIKEKYWAKDLILLITEHEQLGMQAWLEAYHGVSCGTSGVLDSGDMKGRAGSIQAAINLEFHDVDISKIDIKIEGLNGQLPNLDLFNLANKMCMKEGLEVTFKNRAADKVRTPFKDWSVSWRFISSLPKKLRIFYKEWKYSFVTLMNMVSTQATGTPNGNHGLFYRFAIQALTLEGFGPTNSKQPRASFYTMGRILEGTFRSLNNLLERFHQSFFFYLLPAHHRYISIGLYIPALALLIATLYIKGYAKWCQLHETYSIEAEVNSENVDTAKKIVNKPSETKSIEEWKKDFENECNNGINEENHGYGRMWIVFLIFHALGFCVPFIPQKAVEIGAQFGYQLDISILIALSIISIIPIVLPLVIRIPHQMSMTFLNIVLLMEFAIALNWIAMFNISLAMFLGAIYIPLALLINPSTCKRCTITQKLIWLLAHPAVVAFCTVMIYTYVSFPNDSIKENLGRSYMSLQKALRFSIEDYLIYGNNLFSIATCIIFPIWSCFWFVTFTPLQQESQENIGKEKKQQ